MLTLSHLIVKYDGIPDTAGGISQRGESEMRGYTVLNESTGEVLTHLYSHRRFGSPLGEGVHPAHVYTRSKWENLEVGETAPLTFNAIIRRDT